jgi:integrase
MRLPNGYGGIVKLSGKRRRPFMVRITKGFDDEGKQIIQPLGYFPTRKEALAFLASYHENPLIVSNAEITFAQLYEKFCEQKFKDNKPPHHFNASYKWCEPLHNLPFIQIKTMAFQKVIDDCPLSASTKKCIRSVCNQMAQFALANDIITKNYVQFVDMPEQEKSDLHKPFTEKELATLWQHSDNPNIRMVLILCYTGMRPQELTLIRTADVNIEERYMYGGIKTTAGKNRIIPINHKIIGFIKDLYNPANEYLLDYKGKNMSYDMFRRKVWNTAMQAVAMEHLSHDGRHTCASLMAAAGIEKLIRQRILGHANKDVTDKVYTHIEAKQLVEAIDLI